MDAFMRRVVSGRALRFCASIALAALCLGGLARPAAAQYYWATTGTGLWSSTANWSLNATSGGTPGTVPITNGTAFFSQSTQNGDTVVELTASGTVRSLRFLNTGPTLLRASASGTQSLLVLANQDQRSMAVEAGAGAVTFGDATNALQVTFRDQGSSFKFSQHSDNLVRFRNGVTLLSTLELSGTGTGGVWIDGGLTGGQGVSKSDLGTLTLTGSNGVAGLTISSGTLLLTHGSQLGASTYQYGQPEYGSGLSNSGAVIFSGSAGSPNQVFTAAMSGAGSLTWARPSMLTLLGANTQTGTTTIATGTMPTAVR